MATLSTIQVRASANIEQAKTIIINAGGIDATRVEQARDSLIASIANGQFSQEFVNNLSRGIAPAFIQLVAMSSD